MEKKQYAQPEIELYRITVQETIADAMSGDDNELDTSDLWGDFS